MHRFLEVKKVNSNYINKTLIKMRYGGKSNRNLFEIIKQNIQTIEALVFYTFIENRGKDLTDKTTYCESIWTHKTRFDSIAFACPFTKYSWNI